MGYYAIFHISILLFTKRVMWLTCEKDANQSRTFNLMDSDAFGTGFGWYPQGTLFCLQLGSLTQIYSKIQSEKNMKFPKPLKPQNILKHIGTLIWRHVQNPKTKLDFRVRIPKYSPNNTVQQIFIHICNCRWFFLGNHACLSSLY